MAAYHLRGESLSPLPLGSQRKRIQTNLYRHLSVGISCLRPPNILPHHNLRNPILRWTIPFLRMSGKDNRPLPIRIPQDRYQSVHRASDVFFSFGQYWPRTQVPVTAERTEPHSQSIPSLAKRVLLRQTLQSPITPTLEPHFEQ